MNKFKHRVTKARNTEISGEIQCCNENEDT